MAAARKREIVCRVETITPGRAKEILSHVQPNRRLIRSAVTHYSRDIATGKWVLNGESIVIDWNGNLMQGQHRLTAVIIADKPIQSVVVYGVDPKAMFSFDQGRKRTLANVLMMEGIPHYATISAGATLMYAWSRRDHITVSFAERSAMIGTRDEAVAFLRTRRPGLDKTVLQELLRAIKNPELLNPTMTVKLFSSVVVTIHALIAEKSSALIADRFLDRIRTGAMLPDQHPILQLQGILMPIKRPRPNRSTQLWSVIVAWNASLRPEGIQDIAHSIRRIMRGENAPPSINSPTLEQLENLEKFFNLT